MLHTTDPSEGSDQRERHPLKVSKVVSQGAYSSFCLSPSCNSVSSSAACFRGPSGRLLPLTIAEILRWSKEGNLKVWKMLSGRASQYCGLTPEKAIASQTWVRVYTILSQTSSQVCCACGGCCAPVFPIPFLLSFLLGSYFIMT